MLARANSQRQALEWGNADAILARVMDRADAAEHSVASNVLPIQLLTDGRAHVAFGRNSAPRKTPKIPGQPWNCIQGVEVSFWRSFWRSHRASSRVQTGVGLTTS